MRQTHARMPRAVVMNPLNERARTISYADYRDSDLRHAPLTPVLRAILTQHGRFVNALKTFAR